MNQGDLNLGRRGFFRQAAGRIIRPLADYVENRMPPQVQRAYLRPPGAIPESQFIDTCQRCGACVDICPARAIFSPRGGLSENASGTPVVDPNLAACVVCEGLQCTTVCPSGALQRLTKPDQIHMGLAEVYETLCVRYHGEPCTECVDKCPFGTSAIRFNDAGPPEVLAAGCTGCGVCQLYCPTTPKAIVVKPNQEPSAM